MTTATAHTAETIEEHVRFVRGLAAGRLMRIGFRFAKRVTQPFDLSGYGTASGAASDLRELAKLMSHGAGRDAELLADRMESTSLTNRFPFEWSIRTAKLPDSDALFMCFSMRQKRSQ